MLTVQTFFTNGSNFFMDTENLNTDAANLHTDGTFWRSKPSYCLLTEQIFILTEHVNG